MPIKVLGLSTVQSKHTKEAKFKRKDTYHLTILTGSFFGMIWFSHGSITGNWSIS